MGPDPWPGRLLEAARKYALELADGRRPRLLSLQRTDRLESLAEATAILAFARAQVARQARNLTHPLLCLDAIQAGIEAGGIAGLAKVSSAPVPPLCSSCAASCMPASRSACSPYALPVASSVDV